MQSASTFRCLIAALLLLLPDGLFAQSYWSAQKMLVSVSGPVIFINDKNGREVERIERQSLANAVAVLDRLAPAYGMQAPPLVISPSRIPNAFATMTTDGRNIVGINTAMLRLAGNDENFLAVVMGHELAHLKAGHIREGAQRAQSIALLGAILGAAIDANQAHRGRDTHGLGVALGATGSALINAKFSRDQEREADQLGITAMSKVGFDPSAAAQFWKVMSSARGGGGANGTWMDSHPSGAEREQTLAVLAQQLQPAYLASAHANRASASLARTQQSLANLNDPYPRSSYASLEPSETEVAWKADYVEASQAYNEKKFDVSLRMFKKLADAGDERALTMLGAHAQLGLGRPVDFSEARHYYERAAAKGFGRAMADLGEMSATGRGGDKDLTEAARLYTFAAKRGDSHGMALLAYLHQSGDGGVRKDLGLARELAEKSCLTGQMGKAILATLVQEGIGGPACSARLLNVERRS